jgi:hypothetical protein
MTPAQRAIYVANAPKVVRTPRPGLKMAVRTVPPATIRRVEGRHPTISAVRNESLVTRRNAEIEAVKKAYGGTLPMK